LFSHQFFPKLISTGFNFSREQKVEYVIHFIGVDQVVPAALLGATENDDSFAL